MLISHLAPSSTAVTPITMILLARWKALRHRTQRQDAEADVAACTPLATTATTTRSQRFSSSRRNSSSDRGSDDDAASISSVLSEDGRDRRRRDCTMPLTIDWRHQTLLQRLVGEKNRLVQRTLVVCKLTDASKDMYFAKKQREYDQAIQLLVDTREIIELYAESLLDVSAAVRAFAGNASDVRPNDGEDSTSFLVAAETLEERGFLYLERVRERILQPIDDRVVDLHHVSQLLRERANLQIDVDYAKRTLGKAQKRGDVNVIAEKKKALQVAQLRRREATRQIAQLLRHYDNKQDEEFDSIVTEFAGLTKEYFHGGAALLRTVEPPQRRRRSSAAFFPLRRLTQSDGDREPVAV